MLASLPRAGAGRGTVSAGAGCGCGKPALPDAPRSSPRPCHIPAARTSRSCPASSDLLPRRAHAFLDTSSARGSRVVRTSFRHHARGPRPAAAHRADPPVADSAQAARAASRASRDGEHPRGESRAGGCLELLREDRVGGSRAGRGRAVSRGDVVLLVAPITRDGNDRFGPKNRPLQQGPVNRDSAPTRPGSISTATT